MTEDGFPFFRRLPAEIRLLVWGHVLDAAYRNVRPRILREFTSPNHYARRLAEVSLPVCRESRHEAWRRYVARYRYRCHILVAICFSFGSPSLEVPILVEVPSDDEDEDDESNNGGRVLDRPRFDAITRWLGGDARWARRVMAHGWW